MAKNFKELRDKLPPEVLARVDKRVQEEIKAIALEELRRARKLTQVAIAQKLGVDQGAVSKMEKRSDMYVSTLRGYVEAAGGRLEMRAVFDDVVVDVHLAGEDADTAA
jgi:predicted transcriptional regulator